ncbi:hypothetical protein Moror_10773 [Moniliophthora roreri MCA 2997]|nr:hypothetical protein Moror_10773 [Moniliophthora roreri MCA 2997]
MERFSEDTISSPKSWRKHYYVLREAEAKRLEEIGLRIRSQRLEAEGRKKEREVKFTDRLPPPKRAKTWGAPVQPKTLFQKTRSEASKIQKNMYHARIIPPMPKSKEYSSAKPSPSPNRITLFPPAPAGYANRVTVNTIKRPPISTSTSTTTPKKPIAILEKSKLPALSHSTTSVSRTCPTTHADDYQNKHTLSSPAAPTQSGSLPLKSPSALKKDPMATLFVPKHRAYSQRTR